MVSNYKLIRPIIFGMPNIIKGNKIANLIGMALYAAIVPWTAFMPPFYGLISFALLFVYHYYKDPTGYISNTETDGFLNVTKNGLLRSLIITLLTNWIPLFFLYLILLIVVNFRIKR